MNTKTRLSKRSWIQLNERRAARTAMLLLLLLLFALPAAVQAQFTFTTNNGAITITKYTGSGGAVTIPGTTNGLPVTTIGQSAFETCYALTSVTIPNSVTNLAPYAFWACTNLTGVTIPSSVTSIGYGAFGGCKNLTNVVIPASVTVLGFPVFLYCTGLTGITVDPLNSVYSSVDGVLFDKSQTTLFEYPGARTGAYTIPNSVTSIWDYAFSYCGGLTSVTIPDSITHIGYDAFWTCLSLTSVTIPNGVIGNLAFNYCPNLTSVTIGKGVTSIAFDAFTDCPSLTAITVDALNSVYSSLDGVLFDKSQTTLLACPQGKAGAYAIPNSVTSIVNSAFHACADLSSVTIGNSVTSIGNEAFAYCTGLMTVTIGNGVTSIGEEGFAFCTSLTTVTIGRGVTNIGDGAFGNCNNLMGVYFLGYLPSLGGSFVFAGDNNAIVYRPRWISWNITFGGRPCLSWDPPEYIYTHDNYSATIIQYGGSGGAVTIPSTYDGLPVTSIGDGTFENCYNLTTITIPNSVTSIGPNAFSGCTLLTSVTIPNSVTNIGNAAFKTCTRLISVTLGSNVTSIGSNAFQDCNSLTNVTIPKSVTNIGIGAFWYCSSLTAITVDPKNTNYSSLDGVLFNQSQTTLIQCPGGKAGSYTVPNSVTSIGSSAFWYCTSVISVTIPNGVTSLGDNALFDCTRLTGAYFQGNAPSLGGSSVFYGDTNTVVYYLPGTTGWGTTFGDRPTVLWNPSTIQTSPQTQTAEAGSAVGLRVEASGSLPLFCLWYFNSTTLIRCSTNRELNLTNVQLSQTGSYTVVISNAFGAVTSAPVTLNVIPAVEHRPAAGVKVMGEAGSLLNVDYVNSLSAKTNWLPLDTVALTTTSQDCFDVSEPLPAQRFYRAWQTGTPSVIPSLSVLGLVAAITLTGDIGHSVRLDYINQFGPTDAWVTLAMVTLTNTSQLYFDVSAPGQPQRLYRLVPLP